MKSELWWCDPGHQAAGVTTLTLTPVLLLPASEGCLHIFGTGRSGQAVTQALPMQKTEQEKEIWGDTHTHGWDQSGNEHHEFLGPRNCQSGLSCAK